MQSARVCGTIPGRYSTYTRCGFPVILPHTSDPVLLQRMASDPNGGLFNSPAQYVSCASASNCQTFSSQPQGKFVYSPNLQTLEQAFQAIASQVLRLAK